MTDTPEIYWPGESGAKYRYLIYPIGSSFKAEPGNYIFAKETKPNTWSPIYIGETENLEERLDNHNELPCIRRNGGTHVHVHLSSSNSQERRNEESDLIKKWNPPCNG